MPKKEAPLEYLRQYLPPGAEKLILDYLHHYRVHLTITRERKSVLGDYRHATHDRNHRISVNGNLNMYSFLITLVHELAHLVSFMEYGNRIRSHGREWKSIYRKMLEEFIALSLFPEDIYEALRKNMHNLPASSCADEDLMRVLRRYDQGKEHLCLVEEISEGKLFSIDNGKLFRRGKKVRKRIQCEEIATGKVYLFSAIYEVSGVV